jgi:hypothetical protein
MPPGKELSQGEKRMIVKLYQYFAEEKKKWQNQVKEGMFYEISI